jgi:type VI secretion system secreted protein Hcp
MSIYMSIDGVLGNVTARSFEGWIELDSLMWGLDRESDSESGREQLRTFGTPSFSGLQITKQVDQASPLLFAQSCAAGSPNSMRICMLHAGDELIPYLEYTLLNPLFTHFKHQISGEATNDRLLETLFIFYTQINMRYLPRDEKQILMAPMIAGYDLSSLSVL